MKCTMNSRQAVSPQRNAALSDDSVSHSHALNDTFPNVTLSDIHKKLVELLIEVTKQRASRRALRLPHVTEMTGDSRSQIYARMNAKYTAHDETWPLPFYVGKSPRWWLHEVEAWLEAQAASTTTRH